MGKLMKSRLPRLQALLERVLAGNDIQSRDLKSVLTEQEWEEFNARWQDQKEIRALKPPPPIVEYVKRRQKWALAVARYERYRVRSAFQQRDAIRTDLVYAADRECEQLIEFLNECLQLDPSLGMWLVTESLFGSMKEMLEAGVPPVAVTSRTHLQRPSAPGGKLSKRELKIIALEDAVRAETEETRDHESDSPPEMATKKIRRDFSGMKV